MNITKYKFVPHFSLRVRSPFHCCILSFRKSMLTKQEESGLTALYPWGTPAGTALPARPFLHLIWRWIHDRLRWRKCKYKWRTGNSRKILQSILCIDELSKFWIYPSYAIRALIVKKRTSRYKTDTKFEIRTSNNSSLQRFSRFWKIWYLL